MTTIRIQHEKNYTCIHNDAIRDKRLSWKARGIHHFLLSHPDQWTVNTDYLVKQSGEGRTAILSALKELEKCGYLVRQQMKDKLGQFAGWGSVLTELPTDGSLPAVRKPDSGSPDSGSPDSRKPDCIINTNRVLNTDFDQVIIPPLPPNGEKESEGEESKPVEVEVLDPIPAFSVEQTKSKQAYPDEPKVSNQGQGSAASQITTIEHFSPSFDRSAKNINGSDFLPWEIPGQPGKFNSDFEKHMARWLVKTPFYQNLMPGELKAKVRKHISDGKHNPERKDKLWIEWEAMHESSPDEELGLDIGQISKHLELQAKKQRIGNAIAHL